MYRREYNNRGVISPYLIVPCSERRVNNHNLKYMRALRRCLRATLTMRTRLIPLTAPATSCLERMVRGLVAFVPLMVLKTVQGNGQLKTGKELGC